MLPCAYRPPFRLLRDPQLRTIARSICTSRKSYQRQSSDDVVDQTSTVSGSKHAAEQSTQAQVLPDRRRIVFSGIQPTGVPHLGNYLGALRQWKTYHEESFSPEVTARYSPEQYFSIVDLHALTASLPKEQRKQLRKESFAALLAIGLKNTGSTSVFFQSHVRQASPGAVVLLKVSRWHTIASLCGY